MVVRAGGRPGGEQPHARGEQPPAAEPVADRRAGNQQHGQAEDVGVDGSFQVGQRGVQVLARAGAVVSVDNLVDLVWPEDPPQDLVAALHNQVSRLRRAIRFTRIETVAPGCRLAVDPDDVDSQRFDRLVRAGTARSLSQALSLWHGAAYAEFAESPVARFEAIRLQEARRQRPSAGMSLAWTRAVPTSRRWRRSPPNIRSGNVPTSSACGPCTRAGAKPTRSRRAGATRPARRRARARAFGCHAGTAAAHTLFRPLRAGLGWRTARPASGAWPSR